MSLRVTSGIVTVASGATAPQTVSINASPVNVFSASGNPIHDYSGAINVNISGGTIAVSPFGYQSGTLVGISGGNLAVSGLAVQTFSGGTLPVSILSGRVGNTHSITIANPGSGANWSYTVPSGSRFRILNTRFQFVTDSTSANRTMVLQFTDGTNTLGDMAGGQPQAASLTQIYAGWAGTPEIGYTVTAGKTNLFPLPNNFIVNSGYVIKTNTDVIQAGDQYSAIVLVAEDV